MVKDTYSQVEFSILKYLKSLMQCTGFLRDQIPLWKTFVVKTKMHGLKQYQMVKKDIVVTVVENIL